MDGDSLRMVIHKNQYIAEISKSWEDSLNIMAVAICLITKHTTTEDMIKWRFSLPPVKEMKH